MPRRRMLEFRYKFSPEWVDRLVLMESFANGGTQVTIKLQDGREISKVLVSNSMYPVAVRGFKDLPFAMDEIANIFQTDEDKNPKQQGNWEFWDEWK